MLPHSRTDRSGPWANTTSLYLIRRFLLYIHCNHAVVALTPIWDRVLPSDLQSPMPLPYYPPFSCQPFSELARAEMGRPDRLL